MKKGITMISGRGAIGWFTRFAQVQVLALIALFTVLALPVWATADEESGPTDLPGEQPTQPAVGLIRPLVEATEPVLEPAQPAAEPARPALEPAAIETAQPAIEPAPLIDPAIPVEVVEAHFNKLIQSVVDAAQALARTASASATDAAVDEEPEATEPGEAATQEQAPVSDVATKEAEIDSIAAQIQEEKFRSARRIAELEDQLAEARERLADITSTDGEGFIRTWLVLGPIAVDEKVSNHDEESNKEFLDREYVPARTMPSDGDRATINDTELTWTKVQAPDYFVDLAKVAAEQQLTSEHAAYLGVAYITSEEEATNVKLSIGSDDDSVWRLNGREVIRSYNGRAVDKDQDSADELTLKKGVNVLTFTVLNGDGPTAAAARFLDESGNPVRGLKVSLTPPTQQLTQTDGAPVGDGQPAK